MRVVFRSRRVCGSENRRGLPRGRFYVCGLRENHRGDHVGKLFGVESEHRGEGAVLELDRMMVWRRRL